MNKIYFCPKCHKRVIAPKWIFNSNIKSENGITIACGDTKCKGKVKVKI